MIRIDQSNIQPPESIGSREFRDFIRQMLDDREYKEHKEYHKLLSEQLNEIHNKCAYCETPVNRAGFYLTIDHYRPKGKFTDEHKHPGYYWLGYEWTNLLLACPRCNSRKLNRFPIEGNRVFEPPISNGNLDWDCCILDSQVHLDEKPILLHPVIDNPEEHFIFHDDGKIEGLTERGIVTINILGLNRTSLHVERKKVVDDYYRKVKKFLVNCSIDSEKEGNNNGIGPIPPQLEDIFEEIKKSGEPTEPYSRMGWFLFHNFEEFIIEPLKQEVGERAEKFVRKAFTHFLETNN